MNNYVKLLNNLEELGLLNIKASIDKYIDLINSGNKSIVDALYELSNLEINAKSDRAMQACVKVANFPFLKAVTDFDFLSIVTLLGIVLPSAIADLSNSYRALQWFVKLTSYGDAVSPLAKKHS